MQAVALLLVGPPLPDRSKESTQTKRDTLVLQVGGWACGSRIYPVKNFIDAKVQRRNSGQMQGRRNRLFEMDNEIKNYIFGRASNLFFVFI